MNWPKFLFLSLLLPLLGGFGYLFYFKIEELVEIKKTQQRYQAEIESKEARLSYLIKETEALENDPDKLEGLAREKLGLVEPNEKIYIFEPTPAPKVK